MIQDKVKLINLIGNYLEDYLKKSGMKGFIFQGDVFKNETFLLIDSLLSKNLNFEILFYSEEREFVETFLNAIYPQIKLRIKFASINLDYLLDCAFKNKFLILSLLNKDQIVLKLFNKYYLTSKCGEADAGCVTSGMADLFPLYSIKGIECLSYREDVKPDGIIDYHNNLLPKNFTYYESEWILNEMEKTNPNIITFTGDATKHPAWIRYTTRQKEIIAKVKEFYRLSYHKSIMGNKEHGTILEIPRGTGILT